MTSMPLMGCMADNCAFHSSFGPEAEGQRHVGRSGVRAAFAAIFETFPDAQWQGGRHKVSGDQGVSSWRFVAYDREGRKVDVDGCDLFAFDGELISLKDSFRKARTS